VYQTNGRRELATTINTHRRQRHTVMFGGNKENPKMFKGIYMMKIGCTTNKLSFTDRTSSEYITIKYKPSAREP